MIKDKVIKPLLIATEKVVEYYFPSEEKQDLGEGHHGAHNAILNRSSAGGTTKTTFDETSLSDESNEFAKIKRRLKKLDLNSLDDSTSVQHKKFESPKSHKNLKKRRFRQLERHEIGDEILDPFSSIESSSKGTQKQKTDRKSLKLNEKMLKKASATVDLISQKVQSKNMIQETVSGSFVTNVIELTKEAL